MGKAGKDVNKGRLIGAHCSIAGGVQTAPQRGGELHCSAIQIFTKNSNQWKAPALSLENIDAFKEAMEASNIKIAIAHTGYLINLATVDPAVHANSMESMRIEMERAAALELPYVVVHPGSHKEAGELSGIIQIVENLKILREQFKGSRVQILLETTAGQGSCIGYSFDHFAEIFNRLDWPEDMGVCVDTAHIFQAGYDISSKKGYEDTISELDETIGLDYVKLFHLNDSRTEFNSHSDRHQHIGEGYIGENAFKWILADKRFVKTPMVIETPKGKTHQEDVSNLDLIRSMIK
jgi:deoxyribonuclease-4